MREYEAGIIRTERRGSAVFIMHLSCGEIARTVTPGQFVQVRVCDGTDPFLRRTFSVYGSDPERGQIKLMVEIVGRGTELLSSVNRGECLNIIGPLGKGFHLDHAGSGSCILVAGGVGAAPLFFLSDSMADRQKNQAVFMIGARTAEIHRAFEGLFNEHVTVVKATDDGSLGYHGFVTGLLEEQVGSINPEVIYTCGPHPMMKAVAAVAHKAGIRCFISLEQRMACGIGACYGCAVPLTDGRMVRSCVEGPVFDADEVKW
ncbi:dihydroorotate dehydrogenase electron transfer subunit [bacterium]|nr:dihydroorotate dehydrogenase electron transfer subunit [bacterium]